MKNKEIHKTDELIERTRRLVYLRKKILKLTQTELAERHGISVKTLQNWEAMRHNGLTDKGADKLIAAFAAEGLECSKNWLLEGVGPEPYYTTSLLGRQPISLYDPKFKKLFFTKTIEQDKTESNLIDTDPVQAELELFYKQHPTAIDTMIQDDGLSPFYNPNDHVAGERLFDKEMEKAIGKICIIQTKPGEMIVRLLCGASKSGLFTLKCTNPDTSVKQPMIENIKPLSVAPVIWLRKPEAD